MSTSKANRFRILAIRIVFSAKIDVYMFACAKLFCKWNMALACEQIVKSPISSDSSLKMEQWPTLTANTIADMQTRTNIANLQMYHNRIQLGWKTEITLIPAVMQVVFSFDRLCELIVDRMRFACPYLLLFISFRRLQYNSVAFALCSRSFCKFKWAIKLINSYDKTKSSS